MIPTYHIIKTKANETKVNQDKNWKSVLIAENRDWIIGFEVEKQPNHQSIIYFPNLPDGKTGKIKIVDESKIRYLELPVNTILKSFNNYGKGLELN